MSLHIQSISVSFKWRFEFYAVIKYRPGILYIYICASVGLPFEMEIGAGLDRTDWKRLISYRVENATRANARVGCRPRVLRRGLEIAIKRPVKGE